MSHQLLIQHAIRTLTQVHIVLILIIWIYHSLISSKISELLHTILSLLMQSFRIVHCILRNQVVLAAVIQQLSHDFNPLRLTNHTLTCEWLPEDQAAFLFLFLSVNEF
jgi:hypothetical protein